MQLFGISMLLLCCVVAKPIQLSDGVLTATFNADTNSVNFGSVTELVKGKIPSSVVHNGDINTVWSVDVQHIQHTKTNQSTDLTICPEDDDWFAFELERFEQIPSKMLRNHI